MAYCGSSDYIKPDPDIAGIGVIASFITIALLVMVLVTFQLAKAFKNQEYYLSDLIFPEPKKLRNDDKWPTIDDARTYLLVSHSGSVASKEVGGLGVLDLTIFGLCDTQYTTGLAIGIAAFAKRDITFYHYLVCTEMVWLAVISATYGLLLTRKKYKSSEKVKLVVRIFLAWCLFGLAATLMVINNDDLGYAEEIHPAGPFWDFTYASSVGSAILLVSSFLSMIVDTICVSTTWGTLLYYYVETLIVTSTTPFRKATSFFTGPIITASGQWGRIGNFFYSFLSLLLSVFVLVIWVPLWLTCLLIYWVTFVPLTAHMANISFVFWGMWGIFHWRSLGRGCMKPEEASDEDNFGFGQVVALTLLISPIISNAGLWYDALTASSKARQDQVVKPSAIQVELRRQRP